MLLVGNAVEAADQPRRLGVAAVPVKDKHQGRRLAEIESAWHVKQVSSLQAVYANGMQLVTLLDSSDRGGLAALAGQGGKQQYTGDQDNPEIALE